MKRFAVVAVIALNGNGLAQDCTPQLVSAHAPSGDFGAALLANGDFLAVAAPLSDLMPGGPPLFPYGRVELFRYEPSSTVWSRLETLAPAPSPLTVVNNPGFASSVAFTGETTPNSTLGATFFCGWPDDINFGGNGTVRPFFHVSPAVGWVEGDPIRPPFQSATGRFGVAVAAFGEYLVVGEQLSDGLAHVYRRGPQPDQWQFVDTAVAPAPGSLTGTFGRALAMHGPWIFVGAPGHPGALHGAGEVHVFRLSSGGAIQYVQRLVAPGSNPLSADQFGESLDAEPDRLFVGASQAGSPTGGSAGAVFVYGLVNNLWTLRQRVEPPSTFASNSFGTSVDAFHNALVVGAPRDQGPALAGAAYLFARDTVADNWRFVEQLLMSGPPVANPAVGAAVAVGHWHACVGAPGLEAVRVAPAYPNRDVDADLVRDSCEALHDPVRCPAVPNSTQRVGRMLVDGSVDVLAAGTRLHADQLPPNTFGIFLVSRNFAVLAPTNPHQGFLCLGGPIGRYNAAVLNAGAAGRVSLIIDPQRIPQPSSFVAAQRGETWYFQYWHRDVSTSNPTLPPSSNLTEAARVLFE